ncbi:uncharacterized protein RBU33_020713 [Hipposideros larvatus]
MTARSRITPLPTSSLAYENQDPGSIPGQRDRSFSLAFCCPLLGLRACWICAGGSSLTEVCGLGAEQPPGISPCCTHCWTVHNLGTSQPDDKGLAIYLRRTSGTGLLIALYLLCLLQHGEQLKARRMKENLLKKPDSGSIPHCGYKTSTFLPEVPFWKARVTRIPTSMFRK